MSGLDVAVKDRRLRAPREHGTAVFDPPVAVVDELLAENLTARTDYQYDLQGLSWDQLSKQGRDQLVRQARHYTSCYRDVPAAAISVANPPILLAGHQPELFHAGVWFKNFVLSSLGAKFAGHAVNLLIDNDTMRESSIRVPSGSASDPRLEAVAMDQPAAEVPWEHRTIQDPEMFASFAGRVERTIAPLISRPLVRDLWPLAVQASQGTKNLGQCVAQARHALEGQWGLSTLELPLSYICQSEPFHWFTVHLLAHLPRFLDVYNASLAEYRHIYHIRSRSHPVPELAVEDQWLEAPFWIWTGDDPRRRRLFVRCRNDQIELTDRAQLRFHLAVSADSDGGSAVEKLTSLETQNVKLRPRALITTMYARLVLSDLFLHGIGGAKYDQLTDLIVRRFFGFTPPGFLTLTATALLPIERPSETDEDLRHVDRLLRDLQYHPELQLDSSVAARAKIAAKQDLPHSSVAELAQSSANRDLPYHDLHPDGQLHSDVDHAVPLAVAKHRWIQTDLPRGQRRQRHREICRINEALQPFVAVQRQQLQQRRQHLMATLRRKKLLASRQFAFCLFPEATLRPVLQELSSQVNSR